MGTTIQICPQKELFLESNSRIGLQERIALYVLVTTPRAKYGPFLVDSKNNLF